MFVGDLVNKGPASIEVLDAFVKLGAWSVRGNHDDGALKRFVPSLPSCVEAGVRKSNLTLAFCRWNALQNDPGMTLKPQHAWISKMERRHAEVLEGLPFTISIPSFGVVVVRHRGGIWIPDEMRQLADLNLITTTVSRVKGKFQGITLLPSRSMPGSHLACLSQSRICGQCTSNETCFPTPRPQPRWMQAH